MNSFLLKIKSKIISLPAFIMLLTLPSLALGADYPGTQPVALENPLKVNSITDLLLALLNIVVVIAIPIIISFIIYSGFLYVTAQGNLTKIQEARNALTYSIIGGVLIIGAVAISEIIRNLVNSFQ
jgi:hypothetical protein